MTIAAADHSASRNISATPCLEALFKPTGVDGVYGRTGAYESVVEALAALISRHRAARRRSVPLSAGDEPRASSRSRAICKSFPNLIGASAALTGSDARDRALPSTSSWRAATGPRT